MTELDKPLIFILNYGRVLSVPDLDRLADAAGARWICYECTFTQENENADQVRHALKKAFEFISEYTETGIEPDRERP